MQVHHFDRVRVLAVAAVVAAALVSPRAQVNQRTTGDRQATTKNSPLQAASVASTNQAGAPTNPVVGGGTAGFLAVWRGPHGIANSIASQSAAGLNVAGAVTAPSFAGDGSSLINVNALTLQGLAPSAFVQTGNSNTFTGDQTINGNLNLTGFINNALLLQGKLSDGTGQEAANVIGGFAGDPATGASGNIISPGVIGATIAGGGGSYDSDILPTRPHLDLATQPAAKQHARPRLRLRRGPSSPAAETAQVPDTSAPPPLGIQQGPNIVQLNANWSTIGGGLKNTAAGFASTVAGGFSNNSSGNYAVVAGGDGNIASGSEAAVGGGTFNSAQGDNATVAGGNQNIASGLRSTVGGGGFDNALSPLFNLNGNNAMGEGDTVSGGISNLANSTGQGDCAFAYQVVPCGATVAGGFANIATNSGASVGGGTQNSATGEFAMIPGGLANAAHGVSSFAAGIWAIANYDYSFVWSGVNFGASDTGPNQFVATSPGGFYFYTGANLSSGATLPAGSGSWNSLSDRNVKENFSDIDGKALLAKLATLPILTWNYKTQAASIRHMGPTAQDFHAAFGLGEDDKHISNVDSEGIALAGVQVLYKLTQEKDEKIAELTQALKDKDQKLDELERRLSRLEQVAGFVNGASTTTAETSTPGALPQNASAP